MGYQLLVIHFGSQCPWIPWVVKQARLAAEELEGELHVVDVTEDAGLASRYRLYFPFMTIINESLRLPSPTSAQELIQIAKQGLTKNHIRPIGFGRQSQAELVMPITVNNIGEACPLCTNQQEDYGCQLKVSWAEQIARAVPEGILGFVAYQDDHVVGVVEYLPANLVPYPLPDKSSRIAFITCLYSLENGGDYRGQVLERLLQYCQLGFYREIQVVVGMHTPYPNGPEEFFISYGFQRLQIIDSLTLREGEEQLVLLTKGMRYN